MAAGPRSSRSGCARSSLTIDRRRPLRRDRGLELLCQALERALVAAPQDRACDRGEQAVAERRAIPRVGEGDPRAAGRQLGQLESAAADAFAVRADVALD